MSADFSSKRSTFVSHFPDEGEGYKIPTIRLSISDGENFSCKCRTDGRLGEKCLSRLANSFF